MTTLLKNTITATLLLSTLLIAKEVPDSDEGWHSHRPILQLRERAQERVESKKNALEILDKVLSPFEDMTEYALDKDVSSMKKGYKNIEALEDSGLLAKSVNDGITAQISKDIESLEDYINTKNYSEVALLSTNIFKIITNNFAYSQYVNNQIHMENLDGMGFEILSLLSKKDINYEQIQSIINEAQKSWMFLRDEMKDENSIDSFDLLFKALFHTTIKHDYEMLKILASMDLALVDVIEKQFQ
ncbi:MAG: hypothetical protein QM497_08755 [Sulfurimonas sp.]